VGGGGVGSMNSSHVKSFPALLKSSMKKLETSETVWVFKGIKNSQDPISFLKKTEKILV
jgi:hypothetical protein